MLQPSTWGWAGAPRRGTAGRRPNSVLGTVDCRGLGHSLGPQRPTGVLVQFVGPGEHVLMLLAWSCGGVVRVHRPAQLIGDGPEGVAELLLTGVAHGLVGAGLALQAEIRSASRGLSLLNWLTPRMLNPIT